MAPYAHHPQHYLSTQPSHRLLAYKPPPQPPQPQSFIPTTSATNVATKRPRSPSSSHVYSSPSGKSSRMHPSKARFFSRGKGESRWIPVDPIGIRFFPFAFFFLFGINIILFS